MALTVTKLLDPTPIGDRWLTVNKVAYDSSYPTGGESLTRADLGFASTADDEFFVLPQPSVGYVPVYDLSGQKLLLYRQKDPGAVGGADIPLVEMTNTGDATAVTAMVVAAVGRYRS